jgi:hypothetical protein
MVSNKNPFKLWSNRSDHSKRVFARRRKIWVFEILLQRTTEMVFVWFLKWLMVVVVNFRSEMWRRKNSFESIWRAVFQSNNVIDSVGRRTKLKMHKKNCSSFNLMCFLIWFHSILFLNLKLCFPIVKDGVTVMTKSGENTTVRRRNGGDGEVEHER